MWSGLSARNADILSALKQAGNRRLEFGHSGEAATSGTGFLAGLS
jgi:hypothetical protein